MINLVVSYMGNDIGNACLLTDQVDVACITHINIQENHAQHLLLNNLTLIETVIECLFNHSTAIKNAKFQFIVHQPDNLNNLLRQVSLNRLGAVDRSILTNRRRDLNWQQTLLSALSNPDMMLRTDIILPKSTNIPDNIIFLDTITELDHTPILQLLQTNTYWQSQLTIEKLHLLIQSSQCFIAVIHSEIIAFARVLTNKTSFASLWDVVVNESYRGQGIGTAFMSYIFSNARFAEIIDWRLFTDSAARLYQKFGFTYAHRVEF